MYRQKNSTKDKHCPHKHISLPGKVSDQYIHWFMWFLLLKPMLNISNHSTDTLIASSNITTVSIIDDKHALMLNECQHFYQLVLFV